MRAVQLSKNQKQSSKTVSTVSKTKPNSVLYDEKHLPFWPINKCTCELLYLMF